MNILKINIIKIFFLITIVNAIKFIKQPDSKICDDKILYISWMIENPLKYIKIDLLQENITFTLFETDNTDELNDDNENIYKYDFNPDFKPKIYNIQIYTIDVNNTSENIMSDSFQISSGINCDFEKIKIISIISCVLIFLIFCICGMCFCFYEN